MMVPRRLGPSAPSLAARISALLLAACSGGGGGGSPPPDTTPPTVPPGLDATPTSATSVALSWSASTDAVGVAGYEVLRGGSLVLTTAATSANDGGLAPQTSYCWTVRAYDSAGNRSGISGEACATTPAPPHVGAPAVLETTPAPGAADVAPAAVFTARFDEPIAPATLQGGGLTLRDASGAVVAAGVTWDAQTLTATLKPSAPLAHLGRYTATVDTAVTDVAGNHLVAAVSWTVRIAVKPLVLRRAAGGGLGADCGASRIAFADFDGDGHLDAAFVCFGTSVWIARGDGAGGFAGATGVAIGPPQGYSAAALTGVAAADLDGDGYPDLAASEQVCTSSGCQVGGFVAVVLNRGAAGAGTFGTPARLAAGQYPMDVVAADLDGDGKLDLASVELWSNRLSVFLGNGDGTFASAVAYSAASPASLVAARLRPNGPLDLVPSGGPVLLGDGKGAFAPSTGDFAPGLYPMDVAAADLDGDGAVDLVFPNDATDHVTVLRGDGTGGFPNPTTLATGRLPGVVRIADLNGDAHPDLVVQLRQNGNDGTNTTVVLLGVGGGEFAPPLDLVENPFAVADLDGDGRPDLVGRSFTTTPPGFVLDVWLGDTPP